MPTIEFHGFESEQLEAVLAQVRHQAQRCSFASEIVLLTTQTKVMSLDGRSRPFLRILTRKRERADILLAELSQIADIEILFIEFYPEGMA